MEKKQYLALSNFRDRNNFNLEYKPGMDVSHLSSDVLKSLINRGLVDIAKEAKSKQEKEPSK